MTNLTKEPLVHFFLIGAALFFLHGWRGNPAPGPGAPSGTPTAQIVVTAEDLRQLEGVFARTWQRPPTAEERARLVEDLVRNEIYYREALAIGLDRDDQVLKRRLRQKMEFVFEDVSAWVEPTDQDLEAFMRRHRERYLADPAIAFEHVYFSPSRRGPSAEPDARKALAQLAGGVDPETVGDPTLLEPHVRLSPVQDIGKQFGDDFARSLLPLAPGRWAGPLRSGYGLHLVLVKERREGRLPALAEIREAVKRDWLTERQQELKDAAYARLRARYSVIVERPGGEAARPAAGEARER